MYERVLGRLVKHLPGYHDQGTHGNWADGRTPESSGTTSGSNAGTGEAAPSPANPTSSLQSLASKDMPTRQAEWAKLPVAERDRIANAEQSVRAYREELLKPLGEWKDGPLEKSVTDRLAAARDLVHAEGMYVADDILSTYIEFFRAQKVDEAKLTPLIRLATDAIIAQEIEATGRQLGDHGAHHVAGDIERNLLILASLPNEQLDGETMADIFTASIFHDTGYLADPSRMGLDEGHQRWSQHDFDANVLPLLKEVVGDRRAREISHYVRTHDTSEINWQEDPIGSAMRVSDNTALFQKDKLPGLFRYAPKNLDVLFDLQEGNVKLDEAKALMKANIDAAKLPAGVSKQLYKAADEVSPVTGKFTLGMLGGTIHDISWKDDHVVIALKEDPELTKWNKLMDLGQRQFGKFAEAYGSDPNQFKSSLNFQFKDKSGKTLLEGVIVKGEPEKQEEKHYSGYHDQGSHGNRYDVPGTATGAQTHIGRASDPDQHITTGRLPKDPELEAGRTRQIESGQGKVPAAHNVLAETVNDANDLARLLGYDMTSRGWHTQVTSMYGVGGDKGEELTTDQYQNIAATLIELSETTGTHITHITFKEGPMASSGYAPILDSIMVGVGPFGPGFKQAMELHALECERTAAEWKQKLDDMAATPVPSPGWTDPLGRTAETWDHWRDMYQSHYDKAMEAAGLYRLEAAAITEGATSFHGVHSVFLFESPEEGIIRHEFGHRWHDVEAPGGEMAKYLNEHLGPSEKGWPAPTTRAQDNYDEFCAETFTIYTTGRTDLLHPAVVAFYDEKFPKYAARRKGEKHMPGYHDQGSHGNRYGPANPTTGDRNQTHVGRGSPDQHIETEKDPERIAEVMDIQARTLETITPTEYGLSYKPPKTTKEVMDRSGYKYSKTHAEVKGQLKDIIKGEIQFDTFSIEAANDMGRALVDVYANVPGLTPLKFLADAGDELNASASRYPPCYVTFGHLYDRPIEEVLSGLNRHYNVTALEEFRAGDDYTKGESHHASAQYAHKYIIEGVMRHELGHVFHAQFRKEVYEALGIGPGNRTDGGHSSQEMRAASKLSPTSRGKDNLNECMAEAFSLYSIGMTDMIKPELLKVFETHTKWKWEKPEEQAKALMLRLIKHMAGYHDQGSHGNRYGADGNQTSVGRSTDPNQVIHTGPGNAYITAQRRFEQALTLDKITPTTLVDTETLYRPPPKAAKEVRGRLGCPTFESHKEAKKYVAEKGYVKGLCQIDKLSIGAANSVAMVLTDYFANVPAFKPLAYIEWRADDLNMHASMYGVEQYIAIGELYDRPLEEILDGLTRYYGSVAGGALEDFKAGKDYTHSEAVKTHSQFAFKDMIEGNFRHEMGHIAHNMLRGKVNAFFKITKPTDAGYGIEELELAKKYAPTKRGDDTWNECIAENFTLYSIGRTELMHPDMVKFFEENTKWRWEGSETPAKAAVAGMLKHLPGYHDQGSHGNRYGASAGGDRTQTHVGRGSSDQHITRDVDQYMRQVETQARTVIAEGDYGKPPKEEQVTKPAGYSPSPKDRVRAPKFETVEKASDYCMKFTKEFKGYEVFNLYQIQGLGDALEDVFANTNIQPLAFIEGLNEANGHAPFADAGRQYIGIGNGYPEMTDTRIAREFSHLSPEDYKAQIGDHLGEEPRPYPIYKPHSNYAFKNYVEGVTRHEMGHIWHNINMKEVCEHFGISPNDSHGTSLAAQKACTKYAITNRGDDRWNECIAENFSLYSVGAVEQMHPDMIACFEKLTKWKWPPKADQKGALRRMLKHMPGFHDQGSHGNRYGADGNQTQVGRSTDPNQVVRSPYMADLARYAKVPPGDVPTTDPDVYRGTMSQLEEPKISKYTPDKWPEMPETLKACKDTIAVREWGRNNDTIATSCTFSTHEGASLEQTQRAMFILNQIKQALKPEFGINKMTSFELTHEDNGHEMPGELWVQVGFLGTPASVALAERVKNGQLGKLSDFEDLKKQAESAASGRFDFYPEAARFATDDWLLARTLHEMGHLFSDSHEEAVYRALGGRVDPERRYTVKSQAAAKKYAPTLRGADNFAECMAENFALYAMGKTEKLHPDVIKLFETVFRDKPVIKRAVVRMLKHLQGYHDQASHGAWAAMRGRGVASDSKQEEALKPVLDRIRSHTRMKDEATTVEKFGKLIDAKGAEPPEVYARAVADVLDEAYLKVPGLPALEYVAFKDSDVGTAQMAFSTPYGQYDGETPMWMALIMGTKLHEDRAGMLKLRQAYLRTAEKKLEYAHPMDVKRIKEYIEITKEQIEDLKGTTYNAHSKYAFENILEGVVRHEVGHMFYQTRAKEVEKRLIEGRKGIEWTVGDAEKYAVTTRAKDSFHECMAENFALYSAGKAEKLHPDMVKMFDELTSYKTSG